MTSHNKGGVYKHFVCTLLHEQAGFSGRAPSRREHTRLTTHRNLFQVPIFSKTRSSRSPAEARGLTELHSPQARTVNAGRNSPRNELLISPETDCEPALPTDDNTAFPSPHRTRSFPLIPAGFEPQAPHAEPPPPRPAQSPHGAPQPRPGPTFEPAPGERARPAGGANTHGHRGGDTRGGTPALTGRRARCPAAAGTPRAWVAASPPSRPLGPASASLGSASARLGSGSAPLRPRSERLGPARLRPLAGTTRERRAIPPAALRAERCALPLC